VYAHQLYVTVGRCINDLELIAKVGTHEDLANAFSFCRLTPCRYLKKYWRRPTSQTWPIIYRIDDDARTTSGKLGSTPASSQRNLSRRNAMKAEV